LQRLDAVHRRHAPVDQQRVEDLAALRHAVGHAQRLLARGRFVHVQAEQPQPFGDGLARLGQVVHQQHTPALQHRAFVLRLHAHAQPGREPEGAAFAQRAVDAHLTAHQRRQVPRQRQAQAGAAVAAAGGAVELLEGGKQRRQPVGRDAGPGVAHREAHLQPVAIVGQAVRTAAAPSPVR
jgi:hypothetical protein